jgi:predicted RNase H-like HicB family nuclease
MAEYNFVIEKGEDGYLISEVVEIPGCHTQAKTMDQLIERTKEAIELCLEVEEQEKSTKVKFSPRFIGIQKIEV